MRRGWFRLWRRVELDCRSESMVSTGSRYNPVLRTGSLEQTGEIIRADGVNSNKLLLKPTKIVIREGQDVRSA